MNVHSIRELAAGLRTLLTHAEDSDHDAATIAVCAAIRATGAEIDIEQDDDAPDNYGDDAQYVTSTHTLTIGGEAVAEWVRAAVGDYGAGSHERSDAATWLVVEDDHNDERPRGALLTALDALGISDDLPDVEEPGAADEDDTGEYAVLFRNTSDAGWREWSCSGRYKTAAAATQKCEENGRQFRARNSPGSYGPEWCVGALHEEGWQVMATDSDD